MAELRIIFDGVIAIGPPYPREEPLTAKERTAEGPLYAVMARSTRRQTRWSKQNPREPKTYIPAHHPTLFTKLTPDIEGGSRIPDEVYRKWNLWHPVRERLEFRFDDERGPGQLVYQEPRGRNAENRIEDITAVPDMYDIFPDRTLRPELLEIPTANAPAHQDVASQVFVPKGTISGGGDREKGKGADVRFTPQSKRGWVEKTIVPYVIVTVHTELVTIFSYSLDTGEKLDPIVFRVTENSVIRIANGDPSDMISNFQRLEDAKADLKASGPRPAPNETLEDVVELFNFEQISSHFPTDLAVADLSRIVVHPTSSGFDDHAVPRTDTSGNSITETPFTDAPTDIDLDFELFYDLLTGDDEGVSPVPQMRQGNFPERNCFTCQIRCICTPRLKSEEE